MRRSLGWTMGLLGLLAGLLGGCEFAARTDLKPGVSTVEDVKRYFGPPDVARTAPDGSQVLEFPRGPAGYETYRVEIGPDGKYRGMTQILVPATFARVQPGMTADQVRDLLGRPTERTRFALKDEDVWSWRYKGDMARLEFFNVHFGPDGRVRTTSTSADPDAINRQ